MINRMRSTAAALIAAGLLAVPGVAAAGDSALREGAQQRLASLQPRFENVRASDTVQRVHLKLAQRQAELAQRALGRNADMFASKLAEQVERNLSIAEGRLTPRQEILNLGAGVKNAAPAAEVQK